jgi:uncharacterized protein (DUF4415 family)
MKKTSSRATKRAAKQSPARGFRFAVVEERGDEVTIEVTPEDYERERAAGVEKEFLLKPGRHKFIRGGFKKMHPDYDKKTAKVRITINLDQDVLEYFTRRAALPDALPYQTQINQELRRVMERDERGNAHADLKQELLADEQFIRQLAARLPKRRRSA